MFKKILLVIGVASALVAQTPDYGRDFRGPVSPRSVTSDPSTCTAKELILNTANSTLWICPSNGGTPAQTGGGGGSPTGAAGGDLAGTYPNPTLDTSIAGAKTWTGAQTMQAHNAMGVQGVVDGPTQYGVLFSSILSQKETLTGTLAANTSWAGTNIELIANPTGNLTTLQALLGFNLNLNTDPTNTSNIAQMRGLDLTVDHEGSGVVSYIRGLNFSAYNGSATTIPLVYGMMSDIQNFGAGIITKQYNYNAGGAQQTGAGSIGEAYGYFASTPVVTAGSVGTNYAFYAEDQAVAGIGNIYYEWYDSRGVFRIREDSTFNSVGQAIPALYNPQFTKYTPGHANFERVVLGQWNSNVAEIGTETGGTGTLRALRLIGASVSATNVFTSSNLKRGSGTPEGAVTGVVGDIYQRTNGGAATSLYIKESGAGNTGWVAAGAGGGSGTVTTVGWTGGIVSIANPTTTPAFTIAGTSGGIPYFSGATTWATSGAMAAGQFMLGGGAGAAPTTSFSVIPLANGGAAAAITASNGGIVYSTASALAVLAGTATAGQIIRSGASTTPAWSTATYPATTTINRLLWSSSANVIADLATTNGGILNAGATGVPSVTVTPVLGLAGTSTGTLGFSGVTSGVVTIQPASAAGTWTFTLPANDGDNLQVLQTNGSGVTSWVAAGTGDVSTTANATFGAFAYDFTASTVSLQSEFARTDVAKSWTTVQTYTPSATLASLKVGCTTLPSTAAQAGGITCNSSGIPGFNDGATANVIVTLTGTGAAYAAAPTNGHLVKWGGAYNLTTLGTAVWPITNGGTGTASTLTGLMRGSASAMTAAELSGHVATSGSNATVIQAGVVTPTMQTAAGRTGTKTFWLDTPVTGDSGRMQIMFPNAVTITRVSCATKLATSTVSINLDERAAATPDTAGTDVLTSALVCDTDEQASTTFTNAGIASRVPVALTISAIANAPTDVRIQVEYTVD